MQPDQPEYADETERMQAEADEQAHAAYERGLAEGRRSASTRAREVPVPPDVPRWWLCPNDPPCPHGGVLHDIEDWGDEHPTCCVEGCDCGDPLATPEPAPKRRQHDPSLLMEEPDLYPKVPDDERRADDAHMAAGEAWMEHDAEQAEARLDGEFADERGKFDPLIGEQGEGDR